MYKCLNSWIPHTVLCHTEWGFSSVHVKLCVFVGLNVREGPACMAAPCLPPSALWCASRGSTVGLWCLAASVESTDGRNGGRERCVVALIRSAILVSTNQGLPVSRGARVHTHRNICMHTVRNHNSHTHLYWFPPISRFLLLEYCLFLCPDSDHLSPSVCLAPHNMKLAIKQVRGKCKRVFFPPLGWVSICTESRETTTKSSRSPRKASVPTWTRKRGREHQLNWHHEPKGELAQRWRRWHPGMTHSRSSKSFADIGILQRTKQTWAWQESRSLHVHKVCNTICDRLAAPSLCGHDGMWNPWAICWPQEQ